MKNEKKERKMKISLWVETQKIQEIHIWIAESRTKKDQKHLNCTRGAGNFDLCLLCPNWTSTSALWLLRLMAASIGFYSVKSWLRHMTLEMHSKCIRLRRFILHSEYGKMPAHDFLIGLKPTDGATNLGQTPRTHCGVMASKKCEGCHSLRLISWVAWQ